MFFPNLAITNILDAAKATGAFAESATLQLIGQPLTPAGDTAAGDIVVPTFTGYADAVIAAWVSAVDADGIPYLTHAPSVFSPTNGTDLPQYIYGAAVLDSNGDLICISILDTPVQLSVAGQQLHATAKVRLDGEQTQDMEVYTV